MGIGRTKTSYSPIAVDFGADSLKLLQIIPGDPPRMVAAGAAPLTEQARSDAITRHVFYLEALKRLLKAGGFKGKKAICSLPANQTLTQHLQLPSSDMSDLESQVASVLRERLNVDSSRMVVRTFEIGPVANDGHSKREVICVAASRDTVMRHIATARSAKLDIIGMHCEALAILKAFEHLNDGDQEPDQSICFIDLGAASTKVVIAHGSDMVFAKTIHVGGDHFTRQLALEKGISFSEARQWRIRSIAEQERIAAPDPIAVAAVGRAAAADDPAPGVSTALEAPVQTHAATQTQTAVAPNPGPSSDPAEDRSSETLECLVDELQMCLRYHHSVFDHHPVTKLVFLGGESRFVAHCQKIAQRLGVGAQLGDPLARLVRTTRLENCSGVNMQEVQPGWAVPMGLCLSEANM